MHIWKLVFTQSRVNYGYYDEERLPEFRWEWPKGTWFQARIDRAREHQPVLGRMSSRESRKTDEVRTMWIDERRPSGFCNQIANKRI